MKCNHSGDFCVLYVEAADDLATLSSAIAGQRKPVVLFLAEQARAFQRPDDFNALKHARRQLDKAILFVIPRSERLSQLAMRNGFPVYHSMDELVDAIAAGQAMRQRTLRRTTVPLPAPPSFAPDYDTASPRLPTGKTRPQAHTAISPQPAMGADISTRNTGPLPPTFASALTPSDKPAAPEPPPSPALAASAAPTSSPSLRPAHRARSRLSAALIILLAIALTLAGIGSLLMLMNQPLTSTTAPPALAGHVEFMSSEQLSENSNQGMMDQVVIDLNNLSRPADGKSYYAWLLGDKTQSDPRAILLGSLTINNGHAHLVYSGDAQHTNLLAIASRFLVTEESATMPPVSPTPDTGAWRYYGEFAQTPVKLDGEQQPFSYLDHLRHLLARDPALEEIELPGGLDNWLFRNGGKILEWTGSMREQWENGKDAGFVRRQTIRTLAYLDGLSFVKQDLPPGTPTLVNERLARVGLLDVNGPAQDPPGYLTHIVRHLNGLLQTSAPAERETLRKRIAPLVMALNNVKYWLTQVRRDAQQIMKMTDQQLQQSTTLTIINDMIDHANHAYVGQNDPSIHEMRQGIVWIHQQMHSLATLDIKTFVANGTSLQMVPDHKQRKA
ncbi:MAG: hypothetical protein IMW89_08625 [Ktedonobacteraceae bacterium]|nr:hypothetical protein [Ktedonobacteraceae bacterium]